MNKFISLLGQSDKPAKYLLVWQGGNSEYFCEFIHDKDYETAEYSVLQILPKTGINNAVLYKSVVKLNKTNKQHVFGFMCRLQFTAGININLVKQNLFYSTN